MRSRGKYAGQAKSVPFYVTWLWKMHLLFLRLQLWLNDLYIEYYVRNYLKGSYEMEFDPEVVFNSLLKTNK